MLALKKTSTLPTLDFQVLFESSSGLFLVLTPDLTIAAASNSYLHATMTRRDDILGRGLFDVFPDNPDDPNATGTHNLKASLDRVLKNRLPDTMAVQKYDMRKPASEGGEFEERYWSPVNTPVCNEEGEILYILHSVEDVTDFIRLKEQDIEQVKENATLRCLTEQMEATIYLQAQEVVNANRKLDDSRIFLRNVIDHVADPIFVKDRNHRWIEGNEALWNLFGKSESELIGKSDYDFFPKAEADVFWKKDEEVFNGGSSNINIENFTDAAGITHVISTKKACFTGLNNEQILVGVIRDITDLMKMEARLKESDEARLKSIMDHSGRPVYIKDLQGKYLRVNSDLLKMINCKEEDMIGKTDHDFFAKEYADNFRQNDLTVIRTGAAIECEEIAPHPDGPHTYTSVKFPIYDANQNLYAICGISTDITERKQSDKVKSLLAAIVECSDDAIISEDLNGTISSWNSGAEQLFGYNSAEAIGQTTADLIIPFDKRDEARRMRTQLHEGMRVERYETVRVGKNTRRLYVSLTISPIRDAAGDITSYSIIIHDMTERKTAEERFLRYTRELERSNQELDDFAYIASHDLKEPLRGLFNHASFLMEDYSDKLDIPGMQRLNRLSQLCQHMERLVNDLLYFARLGRSHLAIQETDPNAIIDDTKQLLESFIKDYNAIITTPHLLPNIVCDRPRITEVFRNLITNAIKYNDTSQPKVEIGFLDHIDSAWGYEKNVFYVKDNGIGIDPEFHDEIFRIFKRLHNSSKQSEDGTGVGLTFVKKIIERHNGRIWLNSAPGEGTTFYFTLGKRDVL